MPDWAPTPDLIGTLLRSRTQGTASIAAPGGVELGRFTESTKPTLDEVRSLIEVACDEVGALFPGRTPCTTALGRSAAVAAGYRVCQLIEAGSDSTRAEGRAFEEFGDLYERASVGVAAAINASCPLDAGTDPSDDGGPFAPVGRGAGRVLMGPGTCGPGGRPRVAW